MKPFFTILFLVACLAANAQRTLRLINNTDKEVYAAYAYKDKENDYWVGQGWFKINAYSQFDIDLNDYHGSVYIHGYQSTMLGLSEKNWGSGYSLCIDPQNAFTFRDVDKITCANKAQFSEKRIVDGINKWEFNP